MNKTIKIKDEVISFDFNFFDVDLNFSLIKYIECQITAKGQTIRGYSEGFLMKSIKPRAMSEAWERWWMNNLHLLDINLTHKPTSSNGFAAHETITKAIHASRLELLERRDIILSWQKEGVWKKIENKSWNAFLSSLVKKITKKQIWSLEFYEIKLEKSHSTIIGLLIHQSGGIIFDSMATTNHVGFLKLLKLTLSLIRSIPFVQKDHFSDQFQLSKTARPRDHLLYYFNKRNAKAFDTHRFTTGTGISLIKDDKGITSLELINEPGLPALAYSYHPDWPNLKWGSDAYQSNQWPHPIA